MVQLATSCGQLVGFEPRLSSWRYCVIQLFVVDGDIMMRDPLDFRVDANTAHEIRTFNGNLDIFIVSLGASNFRTLALGSLNSRMKSSEHMEKC